MPELSSISALPAYRRTLLGAAALGIAGAAATAAVGAAQAIASGDAESEPDILPTLALTLASVATRDAIYPYFNVRDQDSLELITVDGTDYVVTAKEGFSAGIIQIFRADTGALHFQADTSDWGGHRVAFEGKDTLYFCNGGALGVVSVREQSYYALPSTALPANSPPRRWPWTTGAGCGSPFTTTPRSCAWTRPPAPRSPRFPRWELPTPACPPW